MFGVEEGWLEEFLRSWATVMILKKRARSNDDKHVTILNRLIELQMMKNERVVTMEPDPRHGDRLKENMWIKCEVKFCQRAWRQGDITALLGQNEKNIHSGRHPNVRICGEQTWSTHLKTSDGWCMEEVLLMKLKTMCTVTTSTLQLLGTRP